MTAGILLAIDGGGTATRCVAVSRDGMDKTRSIGRADRPFLVRARDRDGNLDPGVGQELTLDLAWPGAPARPPETVRVLVRDEEERDNYLTGDEWEVRPAPSRHVDLALPDRRTVR